MAGRPNAELFVEWKTGVPMALADTNQSTFMPSGTSAAPGLVPTPPLVAGAVLFLREDGTWAAPSIAVTALGSIPEATIVGRAVGAGDGNPQALSASEATAILNIFVSASAGKKGLVPAPTTSDVGKVLGVTGWVSAAAGGLTWLNGNSVSSSATTIEITLSAFSAYTELYIQFYGLRPTTANDELYCQFSSNGTTYTSTSYDWAYNQNGPGNVAVARGSSGVGQIELANGVGTTSGKSYNGKVYIIEPASTNTYPRIMHQGDYSTGSLDPQHCAAVGGGMYPASMAISAIRFYFSTSTFLSGGRWNMYGYSR